MGNYCSVCDRKVESGKYCNRCYERKYPCCDACRRPLLPNQEKVGNYHKKPCYSQTSSKCCECQRPVDYDVNGAYCRTCYDSKYPAPPRIRGTYNGCEFTLYLRNDELQPLAYSFGRGLSSGGQGAHFLTAY